MWVYCYHSYSYSYFLLVTYSYSKRTKILGNFSSGGTLHFKYRYDVILTKYTSIVRESISLQLHFLWRSWSKSTLFILGILWYFCFCLLCTCPLPSYHHSQLLHRAKKIFLLFNYNVIQDTRSLPVVARRGRTNTMASEHSSSRPCYTTPVTRKLCITLVAGLESHTHTHRERERDLCCMHWIPAVIKK